MVHDKRHTGLFCRKKGFSLMPYLGLSFFQVYNPFLFTHNVAGEVKSEYIKI